MKGTRIYARGAQMEALIEALDGATAEHPVRSIFVTGEQMERLIAVAGGDAPTYPVRSKYATGEQMERLIAALGGDPPVHPVFSKYATAEQMERLIAAVGGDPATEPVPSKYITAEQMARLIEAMEGGTDPLSTISGMILQWTSQRSKPFEGLTVTFAPVQDLHGYSNPWPAGGGKNLFPDDGWTANSYILSDGSIGTDSADSVDASDYIPVKASTAYIYSGVDMHKSGSSTSVYVQVAEYDSSKTFISGTRKSVNSGNVSFTTNANAAYIRVSRAHDASQLQIEAGSSATAWVPYANVCPISGVTGANIHHYGLPVGYTALEYVTLKDRILIDSIGGGFTTFEENYVRVDCQWNAATYKQYGAIYSSYTSESVNATRLIYGTYDNGYYFVNNKNRAGTPTTLYNIAKGVWHSIQSRFAALTVDGTDLSMASTQGTASTSSKIALGYTGCNISYKQFDIRKNAYYGDPIPFLSLVPCTNDQGVAGFYDIISDNFWTTDDPDNVIAGPAASSVPHWGETVIPIDWSTDLFYKQLQDITFDGSFYYDTGRKLIGADVVTMTVTPDGSGGQNLFGAYSGTADAGYHFSLYINNSNTAKCYFRYNSTLAQPILGTGKRTITFGTGGTTGFKTDATVTEESFTSAENAYIGALPLSSSAKFTGTIHGPITVGTRMKFVPCERVSDGAIGYYEVYSDTFITATGSGTPTTSGYETENIDADFAAKANAIYGGTLNVLTGELTITHRYFAPTGIGAYESGNIVKKSAVSGINSYYFNVIATDGIKMLSSATAISNVFKFGGAKAQVASAAPSTFFYNSSQLRFSLPTTSEINTAELANAWIAETHPVFLQELENPEIYHLTDSGQLSTLVGDNVMWADSGEVEVTVYGTPYTEPDADALMSLNILLGGRYTRTGDDPTDEEALDIIMGGTK